MELEDRRFGVSHDDTLGDLENQACGVQAGLLQGCGDIRGQVLLVELATRKIDRNGRRGGPCRRVLPDHGLAAGLT